MAPSASKLEAALVDATCQVFMQDPDGTSVNKVRRHAEEALELDEGFFAAAEWKQKSKLLIKEHVEKLHQGWRPAPPKSRGAHSPSDGNRKHDSPEPQPPAPKRRKRQAPAKTTVEAGSPDSDSGDERNSAPTPPGRKSKKGGDDDEDPESDSGVDEPPRKESSEAPAKTEAPAVAEEDEYSDVIDEPAPPKRKPRAKKETTAGHGRKKPKSSGKTATSPEAEPSSSDQTEVKKLQGQLVKCGVRKLWHNELKQYGDDSRAKIRHLRQMLADVGMHGRFSEARAREIKESRELLAEVEAAREMNALWGTGDGGRASRSKAKGASAGPARLEGSDTEGDGEQDGRVSDDDETQQQDDDDEDTTFAARRRRAQADLAFLGDDSESD